MRRPITWQKLRTDVRKAQVLLPPPQGGRKPAGARVQNLLAATTFKMHMHLSGVAYSSSGHGGRRITVFETLILCAP